MVSILIGVMLSLIQPTSVQIYTRRHCETAITLTYIHCLLIPTWFKCLIAEMFPLQMHQMDLGIQALREISHLSTNLIWVHRESDQQWPHHCLTKWMATNTAKPLGL